MVVESGIAAVARRSIQGMAAAANALVSLAVVAAGIAAYHFTLAARPAGETMGPSSGDAAASLDGEVRALRRDVDALKRRSGDAPGASGVPSDALAALS